MLKYFSKASFKKLDLISKIDNRILFFILLLGLSFIYNYQKILFLKPQSVHAWRQSDCTSLALNYYQKGMKFFHPEVHPLMSNGYTTNEAATSEIPLMYYTVALLYKIFGVHEFIFRLINTLIYFFGLYSLFRLLEKLISNTVWSLTFSLLFFASPILVYYGNNFLTDMAAFSFTLAGWNYFISYYQKSRMKHFLISMLFFLLGMSMKIFAGFSILALLGIFFLEAFNIAKFKTEGRIFPRRWAQIIPFLVIFLIIGGWVFYARNYNLKYHCPYFSTTKIYPYWKLTHEGISTVWEHIRILWFKEFYHPYTLIFFLLMFVFILVNIKRVNKFLITTTLMVFAGVMLYCILFFALFMDHDCYTINLYILLVLIAVTFTEFIHRKFPKSARSIFVTLALIFILFFNVDHTRRHMNSRYNNWWNEYPKYKDFYTITPYLRSIGINALDTVISLPDQSHHTLYLMNLHGWTTCFGQNKDSAGIARSVQHGAKYMIVASLKDIQSRPYINPFIADTLGKYNNTYVLKLLTK